MEKLFMKSPEQSKLIKDWLCIAKENLQLAKTGIKEDFFTFSHYLLFVPGKLGKILKSIFALEGMGPQENS